MKTKCSKAKASFLTRIVEEVTRENGADYTMGQTLITHWTFLQSSYRPRSQDRRRRYGFSTSLPNSATTGAVYRPSNLPVGNFG